mgnify:CR=1 FL=1
MTRKLATLAAGLLAATGLTVATAVPALAETEYFYLFYSNQGGELVLDNVEVATSKPSSPTGQPPVDASSLIIGNVYRFYTPDGDFNDVYSSNTKYVFGSSWELTNTNGDALPNTSSGTLILGTLNDTEDTGVTVTSCSENWGGSSPDYTCGGNEGDTVVLVGSISDPSGPAGSGSSAGGSLPTYLQQFVESPDLTCDEAQPEGLDWSGAPSGGWGESWAQWPNDGQGGNVCSRTLFYNNSTGMWDVR